MDHGSFFYELSYDASGHNWLVARGFARMFVLDFDQRIEIAAPIVKAAILKYNEQIRQDSWNAQTSS